MSLRKKNRGIGNIDKEQRSPCCSNAAHILKNKDERKQNHEEDEKSVCVSSGRSVDLRYYADRCICG